MLHMKFSPSFILAALMLGTICLQVSCKKEGPQPPKNNEIKATITFSSGQVLTTQTSGWNAALGCGLFVPSSWLESRDDTHGRIVVVCSGPCVTAPATTDQVMVSYFRDPNSPTAPVYYNSIIRSPGDPEVKSGSVTFTSVNGDFWEGHFNAICWATPTDSVFIKGTFKGEKRN